MKLVRLYFRIAAGYVAANRLAFLIGVIASIILVISSPNLAALFSQNRHKVIGLAGNYTISSLPAEVQNLMSFGLTALAPDSQPRPAAANFWEATDSGKKITFALDTNLKWQDGQMLNSSHVNYNLKNVELSRPDSSHITFQFKEPFAPLMVLLSQPLFKNGLVGLGDWQAKAIKFTGRFVSQIDLENAKTGEKVNYKFYPTETDLIAALKLGSVTEIHGLHQNASAQVDPHYKISGETNNQEIAVLFFNTQLEPLAEKQLRQALVYALPDSFDGFEKAFAPVPKDSWFTGMTIKKYRQDKEVSQNLIDKVASGSGKIKLVIQASKPLLPTANIIKDNWSQLGIETKVEVAEVVPESYQVYLAYLELPNDPDQYTLWHSTQTGNISHYKSPKIDKLLEDGRRTLDQKERKQIYSDFQKAITEDLPAVFLYYPKIYTVTRN